MREPRPVTRVELSEKNKTLRLIAAIALLIIGAVGITVGIMSLLNKETGNSGEIICNTCCSSVCSFNQCSF